MNLRVIDKFLRTNCLNCLGKYAVSGREGVGGGMQIGLRAICTCEEEVDICVNINIDLNNKLIRQKEERNVGYENIRNSRFSPTQEHNNPSI
jgi:hypothetical protein